jgi:glutamate-1-semialdehyde 2,1-aminomutase
MMTFEPGRVFQGGTYTGNVVSTAAADAVLEFMQTGKVFPQIEKVGTIIMEGYREILTRHNIPHSVNGVPAMFGVFIGDKKAEDWRDLNEANWDMLEEIHRYMIEKGIYPETDGYEPYFLCSDHTEENAAQTLQAFEDGLKHVLKK